MNPVPADSLRAVLTRVFDDPAYRWITPARPLGFLAHWWQQLTGWLARLSAAHPDAELYLVAGLVVVLVVILVHGSWVVIGTLQRASARDFTDQPVRTVEHRDAAWHRREASRLSREGRHAEALMEEFWALVLELDARRLVRFHPSKTPGEYALEPALTPADRADLTGLVSSLYALVFAGRGCGAEDVLAWRAAAAKEWGAGAH